MYSVRQSSFVKVSCIKFIFNNLPFYETAPGLERQPVHRPGEYRPMDVVVRLSLLAVSAHARRDPRCSSRLVSGPIGFGEGEDDPLARCSTALCAFWRYIYISKVKNVKSIHNSFDKLWISGICRVGGGHGMFVPRYARHKHPMSTSNTEIPKKPNLF